MSRSRLFILAILSGLLVTYAAGSDSQSGSLPSSAAVNLTGVPSQIQNLFLMFVKVSNEAAFHSTQSFVCQERIERYRTRGGTERAKHVDTITTKVSFEKGVEQYSETRWKGRPLQDLAMIKGAWSEGEFGTLLKQTQLLLPERPVVLEREEKTSRGYMAIYSFDIGSETSRWDLQVGGQHYQVAFHTRIWVSESSHLIEKIERTSTSIPAPLGITDIQWNVTLRPFDFNGMQWLLPYTAEYGVAYAGSGRKEWNTMAFSDYHRYGSEVAVRFN